MRYLPDSTSAMASLVDAVLLFQDAGGERDSAVSSSSTGTTACLDDGAGVQAFIDKVHGAAGEFHAVFEGLMLGVQAGKRGQQRRVNVQNAHGGIRG